MRGKKDYKGKIRMGREARGEVGGRGRREVKIGGEVGTGMKGVKYKGA